VGAGEGVGVSVGVGVGVIVGAGVGEGVGVGVGDITDRTWTGTRIKKTTKSVISMAKSIFSFAKLPTIAFCTSALYRNLKKSNCNSHPNQ
jgi:hypothetical protein